MQTLNFHEELRLGDVSGQRLLKAPPLGGVSFDGAAELAGVHGAREGTST